MNENNLNITFDIIHHAKERPGAPALVTAEREISYSELDKLVWISAQYLHNQGVRMGDVVAFSFQSELFRCLALLGLARLGATSLCIPNSATPLQRITWEIAAQAIIFITDRSSNFSSGLRTIHFDENSMAGGRQIHFNIMPARADTYISIGIGSGTTGRPKLIPITHRQMRGRCAVFDKTIYHADSRALYLSSLEFTSTQTLFLCLLNIGAAFIFPGSKFTNPA
jgi:acyl-coenzyme A synthetase/AMP-(fatty) acid ligase